MSSCSHLASLKESGPVGFNGEKINLDCIKTTLSTIDGVSEVEIGKMPEKLLEERKASQMVKRIDYLKGKVALYNYRGVPGGFVFSVEQCSQAKDRFLFHISAPGLGSPALVEEVNLIATKIKNVVSKKCGLPNTISSLSKENREATYCPSN